MKIPLLPEFTIHFGFDENGNVQTAVSFQRPLSDYELDQILMHFVDEYKINIVEALNNIRRKHN